MIAKIRTNLVNTARFLVLGMALSFLHTQQAAAQKTQPPTDVHVVNAATDPVPVKIDGTTNTVKIDGTTNTVKIDGTTNVVKAAQSGAWAVGITGTPTVALSGSPTVTLASGAAVQIGNPATSPALVRDVDRRTAQPFRAILTAGFNGGSATVFGTVVPPGKRLVIEFVSVLVQVPSGEQALYAILINFNPGGPVYDPHYLTLTSGGTDTNGFAQYVGTHRVFVTIEPGSQVGANSLRSSLSGVGNLSMTVTGYFVDI